MPQIFELPVYLSLISFICIGIVFYLIGYFVLNILAKHAKNDVRSVPIGAFIGTIATAWAFSLGFVAADIWEVNAKADQATNEERSSIARILGSASPEVLDQPQLTELVLEYRRAVAEDEWLTNKNVKPADSVDHALQNIRREIVLIAKQDTEHVKIVVASFMQRWVFFDR